MKYIRITAIVIFCFGLTGLNAQKVNVDISNGYAVMDGIEEEAWDDVAPIYIDCPIGNEQPTVTAYWKAVWNDPSIMVLVHVEDDDHYPAWESGGDSWSWDFDRPEIYIDVNDTLVDGLGPSYASSGHYQFAPGFAGDGYGDPHIASGTSQSPGGTYAYALQGENYVYEQAITISSMSNKDGDEMDYQTLTFLPENIGFDVTIVDQDKDITTSRQRYVWQSGDGAEAEAWNSMDACGTITLVYGCDWDCWAPDCCTKINDGKTVNVAIHPNPVTSFLTIDADFDKVVINNILGQEVLSMDPVNTGKLDVGYLSKGLYILKVYKGEQYIGAARIMKN